MTRSAFLNQRVCGWGEMRSKLRQMPVDLLAILAVVPIALAVGLWRTRDERAAAREERRR